MVQDEQIIKKLESISYKSLDSDQKAKIFFILKKSNRNDLSFEDFERVYMLPTTYLALVKEKLTLSDVTKWQKELENLAGIFQTLNIIDDQLDQNVEIPSKNSIKEFSDHEKIQLIKYEKLISNKSEIDLSIWTVYTQFLQQIYLPYGEYVDLMVENVLGKTRERQKNPIYNANFILSLNFILQIQQILDDVADWRSDLKSNKDTYITRTLLSENQNGIDKSIDRGQKETFLLVLLPKLLKDLTILKNNISAIDLGSERLNNFYSNYSAELFTELQSVQDVIGDFMKKNSGS